MWLTRSVYLLFIYLVWQLAEPLWPDPGLKKRKVEFVYTKSSPLKKKKCIWRIIVNPLPPPPKKKEKKKKRKEPTAPSPFVESGQSFMSSPSRVPYFDVSYSLCDPLPALSVLSYLLCLTSARCVPLYISCFTKLWNGSNHCGVTNNGRITVSGETTEEE